MPSALWLTYGQGQNVNKHIYSQTALVLYFTFVHMQLSIPLSDKYSRNIALILSERSRVQLCGFSPDPGFLLQPKDLHAKL